MLRSLIAGYENLRYEVEAQKYEIVINSMICLISIATEVYAEAINRVASYDPATKSRVINVSKNAIEKALSVLQRSPKAALGILLRELASLQEIRAEIATQLDSKRDTFEQVYRTLTKARRLGLPNALPCICVSIVIGVALVFLMPVLYALFHIPLFANATYVDIAASSVPLAAIALLIINAYIKRSKAREMLRRIRLVCREYLGT